MPSGHVVGKMGRLTPLHVASQLAIGINANPMQLYTGGIADPADFRRRKIGQIYLYRRNFTGGFYGASEIFLTPRKTTV